MSKSLYDALSSTLVFFQTFALCDANSRIMELQKLIDKFVQDKDVQQAVRRWQDHDLMDVGSIRLIQNLVGEHYILLSFLRILLKDKPGDDMDLQLHTFYDQFTEFFIWLFSGDTFDACYDQYLLNLA